MREILYHPKMKLYRDQSKHVTRVVVDLDGVEKQIDVGVHGPLRGPSETRLPEGHPNAYDYLLAGLAG